MARPSEHPYRNVYPHELQSLRDVVAGFSWDHADSVVLDCMSWSAGVWSCRIGSLLGNRVVCLFLFLLYFGDWLFLLQASLRLCSVWRLLETWRALLQAGETS